jgi:hypothetical protein
MVEMGEQLLRLPPATPEEQVAFELRRFFYQLGRTVSLAPSQVSLPADQVRWIIISETDRFNSIRTALDYRTILGKVLDSNPGLEPAVNQMARFCGDEKHISVSIHS